MILLVFLLNLVQPKPCRKKEKKEEKKVKERRKKKGKSQKGNLIFNQRRFYE